VESLRLWFICQERTIRFARHAVLGQKLLVTRRDVAVAQVLTPMGISEGTLIDEIGSGYQNRDKMAVLVLLFVGRYEQ